MTVAVVTANYGGHDDPPRAPARQSQPDVEWFYFTDDPAQPAEPPWETVHLAAALHDPNLSAKVYKATPFLFLARHRRDVIWIDANMEITGCDFVVDALAARRDGIAVWQHPRRDCVYAEADASLGAESQGGKYEEHRQAIGGQMRSYIAEGYPAHRGLFACGTVAWDLADERVRLLGDLWLEECVRWSPQDQLSLPVVCWRLGVEPGIFPLPQIDRRYERRGVLGNAWLRIHPHRPRVGA